MNALKTGSTEEYFASRWNKQGGLESDFLKTLEQHQEDMKDNKIIITELILISVNHFWQSWRLVEPISHD